MVIQYEKAIENEMGPTREDDEQEIEMLKSLYRNATDEEEDPDAEDNIVPLFDKDKLH